MKRLLQLSASVVVLGSSIVAGGCASSLSERVENRPGAQARYDEVRDPCWPERYNYEARKPVIAAYAAHVNNGHISNQTIVNGDFEQGKDVLTAGGMKRLDTIVRARPADGQLFLAKTRDLAYDAAKPNDYTTMSSELDAKRINAIQTYLNATNSGRNLSYSVTVIDPADQFTPAAGPGNAYRGYPGRFEAGINAGGTAATGIGGNNPIAIISGGLPTGGAGTGAGAGAGTGPGSQQP